MKPGDLVGFVSRVRSGYKKERGFFEVTDDQNNDFVAIEEAGGKWRYVLLPPDYYQGYDRPRGRINLVTVHTDAKFICMGVGFNSNTCTHWCVLLAVEHAHIIFSSSADELFEVLAESNVEEQ